MSGIATGSMPIARRVAGVGSLPPAIVIFRQEVIPMNTVTVMGAPLLGTIARLR
jgi:hypothetical protein